MMLSTEKNCICRAVVPNAEMHRFNENLFEIVSAQNIDDGFILDLIRRDGSSPRSTVESLSGFGYVRRFEDTWFPGDCNSLDRSNLLRSYFDAVAPEYDSKISQSKNIACYKYLLKSFAKLQDRSASVLDFGCGPGTILRAIAGSKSVESVTGFDFSDEMRRIATERGLATISTSEFNALSGNAYDLITMCYVMHFQIDKAIYERLINLLKNGGAIIGNVHKDIGLSPFLDFLCTINGVDISRADSAFGSVITIRKGSHNVG